tara:strand:+ start:811 stop:1467 length:657 start_codon:yes stop_codon:yes gene_type:complete
MVRSIETIWKEGFVKSDTIVAPKLNDLYNKKSVHIVDKFTRMFKINLVAIVIGSFVITAMSVLVHIPYMGLVFFFLLNTLAFINYKLMNGLYTIDKNVNSYLYLKTFDSWMKQMILLNQRFSRLLYPLAFLSVVIGFWFGGIGGDIPGEELVQGLLVEFPDMELIFGLPLYPLLILILVTGLLAYFADVIYTLDFNIVYGRVYHKLDDIITDMEELQN